MGIVHIHDDENLFTCEIKDLSPDTFAVALDSFPKGRQVFVVVKLRGVCFQAWGMIESVESGVTHVRFTQLHPESRNLLQRASLPMGLQPLNAAA